MQKIISFCLSIFLLAAFSYCSYSQKYGQDLIDSLINELPGANQDTNQVVLLKNISFELRHINPKKGIEYGKRGLALSEKIGWKKGMAYCYNNIGVCYRRLREFDSALTYYSKSKNIYEELGIIRGIYLSYNNIGLVNENKGEYDKAFQNYKKAMQLAEQAKDENLLKSIYNNLAVLLHNKGLNSQSLEYHFKSLNIKEKTEDIIGQISSLTNIGNIFFSENEIDKALRNYQKALDISQKHGIKQVIGMCLSNIGAVYESKSDLSNALRFYYKALNLEKEFGDQREVAQAYLNIGSLELKLEKFETSFHNLTQADSLYKLIGDKLGIVLSGSEIGHWYLQKAILLDSISQKAKSKKSLTISIKYLKSAIEIAEEIGAYSHIISKYQNLSFAYEKLGNSKMALFYYKKYSAAKDSIFSEEKTKDIVRIEERYSYEKKEREEEIERIKIEEEKTNRNYIQYSGIFIFIVFLFVGMFFTGKFKINVRTAEGFIFFTFVLLFEFILVILDPTLEEVTNGLPIYKLAFNALIAILIFPIHSFFEEKIKKRILNK